MDRTTLHLLLQDLCMRYSIITPDLDDEFLEYLVNETKCIETPRLTLNAIASEIAGRSGLHPDYGTLAGRLLTYSRETYGRVADLTFSQRMEAIQKLNETDSSYGWRLSSDFLGFIREHRSLIDSAIRMDREYRYNYFALRTATQVYLATYDKQELEGMQDMHMRVAVQMAITSTGSRTKDRIGVCLQEYEDLSLHLKIHATPINTQSGKEKPQLSSCFLVPVPDSISGIYEANKQCAIIHSKMGGCAVSLQRLRSQGATVTSTGGVAAGLIEFMKLFDHTSHTVTAGGRRSGSNAGWCEPHHPDILDFISCRTTHAQEKKSLEYLFLGVMVSDVFMETVESGGDWYLLDPSVFPGLDRVHNDEYRELYKKHSTQAEQILKKKGSIVKRGDVSYLEVVGSCARIKSVHIWNAIKASNNEKGIPYVKSKDSVNRKSQHSNRGTINMSNLCTEIDEYNEEGEIAVCTLGNVVLPSYVYSKVGGSVGFDHDLLHAVTKRLCRNLNAVLDSQCLPLIEAQRSNDSMRSIGIGYQGFADVAIAHGVAYNSQLARRLNRSIMETIHHAALEASCELAAETQPYPHYLTNGGSYLAKGHFHHELMGYSGELMWDWEALRESIRKHGVANSLTTAIAPTSTTSIVCGSQESFQPLISNMVSRNTLSGSYMVTEPTLVVELERLGMWNGKTRRKIVLDRGSVQNLDIPQRLKDIYRTAYEMKGRDLIDMAADREHFVDQSQSLNLFNTQPENVSKLLDSLLMYGWKKNLNTLKYYFRSQPAVDPLAVTFHSDMDETTIKPVVADETLPPNDGMTCRMRKLELGDERCLVCEL